MLTTEPTTTFDQSGELCAQAVRDEAVNNSPPPDASAPSPAHAEPSPSTAALNQPAAACDHQMPAKARGGAPKANGNATRHGLRGSKFPPDAKSDESHVHELVRKVREAYIAKHRRDPDLYGETVIQRIRRAEGSARLAARWLRKEGDKLSLPERAKMLDIQTEAGNAIERAMKCLGLDGQTAATARPNALATFGKPPAKTPQNDHLPDERREDR